MLTITKDRRQREVIGGRNESGTKYQENRPQKLNVAVSSLG